MLQDAAQAVTSENARGAFLALARGLEVKVAPAARWERVRGGPLAGRQLLLDTKGAAWQSAMRDERFEGSP